MGIINDTLFWWDTDDPSLSPLSPPLCPFERGSVLVTWWRIDFGWKIDTVHPWGHICLHRFHVETQRGRERNREWRREGQYVINRGDNKMEGELRTREKKQTEKRDTEGRGENGNVKNQRDKEWSSDFGWMFWGIWDGRMKQRIGVRWLKYCVGSREDGQPSFLLSYFVPPLLWS